MSEPTPRLTRASEPFERSATQSESRPDTACDSLLGTVRSTFDPFKQTFSTDGSTFHHVSEAVNALASLQSMPSQLLNTGIAQVPLLDKMPGMPAATIGVPHLGTPHAHSHPPSNGFPLPSVGATIGSGCLSVLIGGIPAARVLDIGIAPTCGGLTPYFDIQTGSSNTFVGGMRAVRMGIDMTRHCNPMGHVGKSGGKAAGAAEKTEEAAGEAAQVTKRAQVLGRAGKAWKVGNAAVGPASGGMTAGDDASQGEIAAAAMMAAQTAADLAMMLLGNLMGKDPGIEPSMGTLLVGNPTVLIGGFPMPDSQMMWHGAKHGLGKRVRPKLPVKLQELACEFWGEPVSAVTGDVRNDFTDYETNDTPPFIWGRHYSTGWHERDGALGYGFRHTWQHELQLLRTRAVYVDPRGTAHTFARGQDGHYCGCNDGYEIEQFDERRFVVRHDTAGDVEFVRSSPTDRIARCVYHRHNGIGSALRWSADDHLERITQSDGSGKVRRAISLRHDTAGRMFEVVVTHADGAVDRIVRYAYDAHGCLIRQQDALNASAHYTYDARRRMTRLTDANGYAFSYRYDEQGRCVQSSGQDGLWHVQLAYQAGRTIVTESDGAQWSVLYNDAGTITRVVDPFGGATEYILGADGRILEEIDSGGRATRWLYDARGRNTGRQDRWGNRWPPKEDAPVLPDVPPHIAPKTPLGVQWGEIHRADLADTVLLPPGIEKIAAALLPRPAGPVAVQRDAAGRIVSRTDAYGYAEQSGFDPVGNRLVRRDRDGRDYRYGIASWNLRESETDPLGNTTHYRYSAKAEVTAIVDANGNESSYAYDHKGRIVGVIRHGVLRETYAYDTGDRLIEKCDGTGALLLRFEVGANGLHCKRILASGQTHHYEYNARGQFTRASTDTFEVRLAYDAHGRRIADKRDGRGIDHFHAGRWLARTTYLDRYTVHYEPRADGEVLIRTPDGGTHRIHRSSDGRILLRLGNGSNVLYGFDVDGRNGGRLTWQEAREGSLRCSRYEYGPTGELRRVVDSARDTIEYEYDDAHRMISERRGVEPVRHFAYDRGGNLLSSSACQWLRYADGNRLHVSSNGQFRYNGRNHLAERFDENNRGITYEYDSMDLLVKIRRDGSNDAWAAEYDGLCRRTRQSSDAEHQIDYYWDGDRLAAEISKQGHLRLYVYPNSTGFLPFMLIDYLSVDAAPDDCRTYFVIHNQVGQPEWIEDETGNTVWRSERIDPYGSIEIADDNLIEYNLRFPGHYFDPTTGLHCNRFRTYDPVLGRYLQSDPAGQSGGINLYAYASNPLLQVDLFGLSTCGSKSDKQGHDDNGSSHEDPAKPGHESEDDGSTAPDSPQLKPLVQVHPSDRALFDPVRKDADAMRLAFRKALGDRNRSTTLLPFIFKKKDGTFAIGIGASGDGASLLSSDPKLAGIAAGHPVVSAPPDPSGPNYPRFTNNEKHEESTDQHAEQQSLRWADSQPDIEGVAYFAPTAHVCEGCRQAIYDRAPYDFQKQKLAFDPDDTIAPKTQSKYFNPPANDNRELPAHFIPGARDRALDEYLNPTGPQPTKKAVAERYGISPSTLKKWIDKKLEGTS